MWLFERCQGRLTPFLFFEHDALSGCRKSDIIVYGFRIFMTVHNVLWSYISSILLIQLLPMIPPYPTTNFMSSFHRPQDQSMLSIYACLQSHSLGYVHPSGGRFPQEADLATPAVFRCPNTSAGVGSSSHSPPSMLGFWLVLSCAGLVWASIVAASSWVSWLWHVQKTLS